MIPTKIADVEVIINEAKLRANDKTDIFKAVSYHHFKANGAFPIPSQRL